MRTQRNSLKGYKINYSTNTISMNYKFAKAAQDFGSPEYLLLKELKADFPMMTAVVEAGRKIVTTNVNKRLTYDHIERHISQYLNADELLEQFEKVKELSKPLASPYKYVCDWFTSQFPEYNNAQASYISSFDNKALISVPDVNNYQTKENYRS